MSSFFSTLTRFSFSHNLIFYIGIYLQTYLDIFHFLIIFVLDIPNRPKVFDSSSHGARTPLIRIPRYPKKISPAARHPCHLFTSFNETAISQLKKKPLLINNPDMLGKISQFKDSCFALTPNLHPRSNTLHPCSVILTHIRSIRFLSKVYPCQRDTEQFLKTRKIRPRNAIIHPIATTYHLTTQDSRYQRLFRQDRGHPDRRNGRFKA